MKRIIYVLVFMIGAAGLFTSCIDNVEPAGLNELRDAKADYYRALAELQKAQATAATTAAEAEKLRAEADAAYTNAQAQLVYANAGLVNAQKAKIEAEIAAMEAEQAHQEAMWKIDEDIHALDVALKEAEVAKANAEAAYEIAKSEALTEVEKAKAAADVAEAQARYAEAQAALAKAEAAKKAAEEQYVIDSLKRAAQISQAEAAIEAQKAYNEAAYLDAQRALEVAQQSYWAQIKAGAEIRAYAEAFIEGAALTPQEEGYIKAYVEAYNAALEGLDDAQRDLLLKKSNLFKYQYDEAKTDKATEDQYDANIALYKDEIAKEEGKIADAESKIAAIETASQSGEWFNGVPVDQWAEELESIKAQLAELDDRHGEIVAEVLDAKVNGLADYLDYVQFHADQPINNDVIDFTFYKSVDKFWNIYNKYITDEELIAAVETYKTYAKVDLKEAGKNVVKALKDSTRADFVADSIQKVVNADTFAVNYWKFQTAIAEKAYEKAEKDAASLVESDALYQVWIDLSEVYTNWGPSARRNLAQFASYISLMQTAAVAPSYQEAYRIFVRKDAAITDTTDTVHYPKTYRGTMNCQYFTSKDQAPVGYITYKVTKHGFMLIDNPAFVKENNYGDFAGMPYVVITNWATKDEDEQSHLEDAGNYLVYAKEGEGPYMVITAPKDRIDWVFKGGVYEGGEEPEENDLGIFDIYEHLSNYTNLVEDNTPEGYDAAIAYFGKSASIDSVKYNADLKAAKTAYDNGVKAIETANDKVVADLKKTIDDWNLMDSLNNLIYQLDTVVKEAGERYEAWNKQTWIAPNELPFFFGDVDGIACGFYPAATPTATIEAENAEVNCGYYPDLTGNSATWRISKADSASFAIQSAELDAWLEKVKPQPGQDTSKNSEKYLGASKGDWASFEAWWNEQLASPRSDGTSYTLGTDLLGPGYDAIRATAKNRAGETYESYISNIEQRPSIFSLYTINKTEAFLTVYIGAFHWTGTLPNGTDPNHAVISKWGGIIATESAKAASIKEGEWPVFVGDINCSFAKDLTAEQLTGSKTGTKITVEALKARIADYKTKAAAATEEVQKDIAKYQADLKEYWAARAKLVKVEYNGVTPKDDYNWKSEEVVLSSFGTAPEGWIIPDSATQAFTKDTTAFEIASTHTGLNYTIATIEYMYNVVNAKAEWYEYESKLPKSTDYGHVYFNIDEEGKVVDADALKPADLAQAYFVTRNAQVGTNAEYAENTIGGDKTKYNVVIPESYIQYYMFNFNGKQTFGPREVSNMWQPLRNGKLALWFQDYLPNAQMYKDNDGFWTVDLNGVYDNCVYLKYLSKLQYIEELKAQKDGYKEFWGNLGEALEEAYAKLYEYADNMKDVAKKTIVDTKKQWLDACEEALAAAENKCKADNEALVEANAALDEAVEALHTANDWLAACWNHYKNGLVAAAQARYEEIIEIHDAAVNDLWRELFDNTELQRTLRDLYGWTFRTYSEALKYEIGDFGLGIPYPTYSKNAEGEYEEGTAYAKDIAGFLEGLKAYYKAQVTEQEDVKDAAEDSIETLKTALAYWETTKDNWDEEVALEAEELYLSQYEKNVNALQNQVAAAERALKIAQEKADFAKSQLDAILAAFGQTKDAE